MGPDRAWLLTPSGPGAIAVIRFHGERVAAFFSLHFSRTLTTLRCVHGELHDGGTILDDPVVVRLDDQTVDVNLHGGGAIVRGVLALAERHGFVNEPPPPGATVASIESEVAAALPLARTRLGLAELLAQPAAWRAHEWTTQAKEAATRDRSLHWLLHPPTVAIIGIPNAGKSTLANQLFGQNRSITLDLAGTTRDWVGEIADIDGLPVMLIDTPGIHPTVDELEATAISRSHRKIDSANLVLLLLDSTQPRSQQVKLLATFRHAIYVVNKCDQAPLWLPGDAAALRIAARTGQGIPELRAAIRQRFLGAGWTPGQPRIWTERQRRQLSA